MNAAYRTELMSVSATLQAFATILTCLASLAAAPARAQRFEPRPGLEALPSRATGVFEIGAVDIGPIEVVLRALVHNGLVLQVHGQQAGRWLAKRSGSLGGKPIAPTTLDELASVAGGLNTDVRCESSGVRAEFARAADIVLMAADTLCLHRVRAVPEVQAPYKSLSHDTGRIDCSRTVCRVQLRSAAPGEGFQIRFEPERSTWSFVGYGIIAIWSIPEA